MGARGSAVETAYQALRERIVSGSYEPGHAFSQVQLARELDLSRTPLREALQRLEAEGLVVSQANRGVVVAPIDLFDLESSYALRLLVEPAVVSAVLGRVDGCDVDQMRRALADMRANDQSSREFQLAHWEFHRVILKRCPPGFQSMIESQLTQIDRHQRLYFSRAVAVSDMTVTDTKFLEAVEAGDAVTARDVLTFHLLDTALGVIVTQDPRHRFCTLPIAVEGQTIELSGLDELGAGRRAQISWRHRPTDVVRNLETTHLRVG
ncbi:GntR family transcriptional regulator [Gordonia aurantiaca]|uniref:GntR family transcriptional regulator n=1 Tax=Gordonia sp. B21 TaxID=3151852 RepID=UPI00326746E8